MEIVGLTVFTGGPAEAIERFPALDMGQWYGNAQRRDYTADTGFELHNCVEAGAPFEQLIDQGVARHPLGLVRGGPAPGPAGADPD